LSRASIFRSFTIRFSRARAKREGRPPILGFCFRCGFTPRSKAWGRRANWSGLAQSDAAYRWLAGGVPLNDHGLADFRVDSVEVLDRLLTQSVTALIAEGLVSLDEIAVDGTKIRANASRKSFRTSEKLIKIEGAVAGRLAALKQELSSDPGASTLSTASRAGAGGA
jgi:hypothetical protein